MTGSRALQGVMIADFAWIFMGPITTKFLGDFGAEVIKVESVKRPDDVRAVGPYKDDIPGPNRSGIFANYNSSKYDLTLELRNPRAIEVAKRLISMSDVVTEAYRPGTMKELGLGNEEIKKAKPDIIMISMSMQGQTGPLSRQRLLGTQFQAGVGFTNFVGWPDRSPAALPNAYGDFITPWFTIALIMAALDYRRRTGKGQFIETSQLETNPYFLAPAILDYTANGSVQGRRGNRSFSDAPHGVFRCRGDDRWCTIVVSTEEQWQAFCQAVGEPQWSRHPKFATVIGRKENEDEMERLIEEWSINYTPEGIMDRMQKAGVSSHVVQNGQDLLERDEQLRHREHFVKLDHPEIGAHVYEQPPFRLSATPAQLRRAPCLGEDNEYVCTHILGLSDGEFVQMVAEGVFG